eukprot:m.148337 g.148337  ORF g.148337 m.148337 type:complete len:393 (-) comp16834_c3_seq27:3099-4277(-)
MSPPSPHSNNNSSNIKSTATSRKHKSTSSSSAMATPLGGFLLDDDDDGDSSNNPAPATSVPAASSGSLRDEDGVKDADTSAKATNDAAPNSTVSEAVRAAMDAKRAAALLRRQQAQQAREQQHAAAAAVASMSASASASSAAAAGGSSQPPTQASSTTTSSPSKKKRRGLWSDMGAGFLLESSDSEEEEAERSRTRRKEPTYEEPPQQVLLAYPQNDTCEDCGKGFCNSLLLRQFALRVCDACRVQGKADKYALVTKTEARDEYLLKDMDLEDPDTGLKYIEKTNPQHPTWGTMKLYLRCQVEKRAEERWGGHDGLDKEILRRFEANKEKKAKQHTKKMQKLRRSTITSTWWHKDTQHTHVYPPGEEVHNPETDEWTKTCSECGFEVVFEKM